MGNSNKSGDGNGVACPVPRPLDLSRVTSVALDPRPPVRDHAEALALAGTEAGRRLAHPMLLSWYDRDRDRDFEAPQHVSECHQDSAVPGYVDYALSREATLKVDVENGRFVFFYRDAAV